MKNESGSLRLAVQRNGRLTEETLKLLRGIGLEFESYGQRLLSDCRNFPLSILFGRDDDIPEYVGLGTVDLGIVGRNLIFEEEVDVVELRELGYGYCKLVIAVPRDSPYQTVDQLEGKTFATSYPASARQFFETQGWMPEIITLSGSVEVAPSLGLAESIVELTATGSTLMLNDLREIHTVLESQAVLVANKASMADPENGQTSSGSSCDSMRFGQRGNTSM